MGDLVCIVNDLMSFEAVIFGSHAFCLSTCAFTVPWYINNVDVSII